MKRRSRVLATGAVIAATGFAAGVVACDAWIGASARGRLFADPAGVPRTDVALVLGTNPRVAGGRENLFFRYRIEAAAALFHSGAVRHLLVSGDNRTRGYDEPSEMRDALVTAGVPAASITLDYAGFRTLDSVVRAGLVFGQTRIVVVSQAFHCERALFIADSCSIDAVGFVARGPAGAGGLSVRLREVFARVAAVVDTRIMKTAPRFSGPPEPIRLSNR